MDYVYSRQSGTISPAFGAILGSTDTFSEAVSRRLSSNSGRQSKAFLSSKIFTTLEQIIIRRLWHGGRTLSATGSQRRLLPPLHLVSFSVCGITTFSHLRVPLR